MTDLTKMSDEELARWQAGWKEQTEYFILAKKEWERRDRLKQHELDLQLLSRQVRWMKFAVIATILSTLLGVILGAYLQRNWPIDQQQKTVQSTQEKTSVSPVVHPSTINDVKPSSQPPKKK